MFMDIKMFLKNTTALLLILPESKMITMPIPVAKAINIVRSLLNGTPEYLIPAPINPRTSRYETTVRKSRNDKGYIGIPYSDAVAPEDPGISDEKSRNNEYP